MAEWVFSVHWSRLPKRLTRWTQAFAARAAGPGREGSRISTGEVGATARRLSRTPPQVLGVLQGIPLFGLRLRLHVTQPVICIRILTHLRVLAGDLFVAM